MAFTYCCVSPLLALIIVLGIWAVSRSLWQIAEGCQATRWPYTTGTVVNVQSKRKGEEYREVVIRYSYTVGDQTYEGSRIHPAYVASTSEPSHQALEAILSPGRKVRVYYRDDYPATSTLSVGFFSGSLGTVFTSLMVVVMPLGFLVAVLFPGEGAEWKDDGLEITSLTGLSGVVVAGVGFALCFLLAAWFLSNGNGNFAAGITAEE